MVQHNHKRQKQSHHPASGFTLPAGTQGFLLHCTMKRERRAADEILNLLAEYAEKQETSVPVTAGTLENDIERELSELRDKDKQLFSSIHTGIGCCVFIMADSSIEPATFLHHLLLDLLNSGIKKTRYSTRILPIQATCFANVTDVSAMAKSIIDTHLNNKEPSSYAIAQKIKHNGKFERNALIDMIASLVDTKHKVDLRNAKYFIIVEIINHVAGISVVSDYQKLRTYNIAQLST